jgi:hypothetical protein
MLVHYLLDHVGSVVEPVLRQRYGAVAIVLPDTAFAAITKRYWAIGLGLKVKVHDAVDAASSQTLCYVSGGTLNRVCLTIM